MNDNIEKLVKVLDNFDRNVASFAGNEKYIIWDDHMELASYLITNGIGQVVYSRWENVTGGMVTLGDCSECKTRQPVVGTNYCKHCGAKMVDKDN